MFRNRLPTFSMSSVVQDTPLPPEQMPSGLRSHVKCSMPSSLNPLSSSRSRQVLPVAFCTIAETA